MTDHELLEAVRPHLEFSAKQTARRIGTGSLLDADDLLQEGLTAALASRATWTADGGASLVWHAVNRGRCEMIDALRRAARDCRKDSKGRTYRIASVKHLAAVMTCTFHPVDDLVERWEPEAPPEREPASRAEFVRGLTRLKGLPVRVRDLLVSRFADEVPTPDLAAELNLSEARVYGLISETCADLAERYRPHEVAERLGVA